MEDLVKISPLEKLLVNLFTFTPCDLAEYKNDGIPEDISFSARWNKKLQIYKHLLKQDEGGHLPEKVIENYRRGSACTRLSQFTYNLCRKKYHFGSNTN